MFQLPTEVTVRELLSTTLGRDVTVRYSAVPLVDPASTGALARYDDDEGVLRAVAACDLVVAGALGAALALVPRRRVTEAARTRAVPRDLAENLHEVLNVGANLFNAPGRPHVRLTRTHTAPDLPVDLLARAAGPSRLDLRLDVPGYGSGAFSVVGTA